MADAGKACPLPGQRFQFGTSLVFLRDKLERLNRSIERLLKRNLVKSVLGLGYYLELCGRLAQEVGVSSCVFCIGASCYVRTISILSEFFPPTDAQLDSLKNSFKFALKLTLKNSILFSSN